MMRREKRAELQDKAEKAKWILIELLSDLEEECGSQKDIKTMETIIAKLEAWQNR